MQELKKKKPERGTSITGSTEEKIERRKNGMF